MSNIHRQFKPYGRLFSQGREYALLSPQPLARDSCWDNGTYMFYVGWKDTSNNKWRGVAIITSNFVLELDNNMDTIEVIPTIDAGEEVEDLFSAYPGEEPEFFDPVLDDQPSPEELDEMARNYTYEDEEGFDL